MNISTLLKLSVIIMLILVSCKRKESKPAVEFDSFAVYSSKDSTIAADNSIRQVAFVDTVIGIDKSKDVLEKLQVIADTLSAKYFNGLEMEVSIIKGVEGDSIVKVNLVESPGFEGPGTVEPFKSWYDFFQGSYGGMNTTITLKETFLQRKYKGAWIDGVVFYYQGKPMEELDHVALAGEQRR